MLQAVKRVTYPFIQPFMNLRDVISLMKGLKVFNRVGVTPDEAYQAMIKLHGRTNGYSTKMLANYFSKKHPKYPLKSVEGVLGKINNQRARQIANQIRQDGYYIFEQRLPEHVCDALTQFANTTPANIWVDGHHQKVMFDPKKPQSQVYKFDEEEIIQLYEAQDLMSDPSIRAIANEYINAAPILCCVNTWFSPVFEQVHDDHGGQQFHFDMSRAKWLNFFIYLNDVSSDDGPHCYVRSSNTFKNKRAKKLLKRGYVRIPDHDIEQTYGRGNMVELTGKKGTIMAVDTVGFHRGKLPTSQHRLMFELVFASSLFGGVYHQHRLPSNLSPQLKAALSESKYTFKRYKEC